MADPAPARARRPLAVIALAAVLGAVAMAAAAGLTWWTQPFDDSLTGRVDAAASGAATLPELVPVALVVLAGLGATLATRGAARRAVGGLLILAGLLVAVRAASASFTAPAALTGQLVRPATAAAPAAGHPWGPLLAVVGACAVVVAGALVVLGRGAGRRRALGARYERRRPVAPAPTAPPPTAGPAVGGAGSTPADRGAGTTGDADARTVDWWNQLDSGTDPTTGPPADPTASRESLVDGGSSDGAAGPPAHPRSPSTQRGPD